MTEQNKSRFLLRSITETARKGIEVARDFLLAPITYVRQLRQEVNVATATIVASSLVGISVLFGLGIGYGTQNPMIGILAGYGILATMNGAIMGLKDIRNYWTKVE